MRRILLAIFSLLMPLPALATYTPGNHTSKASTDGAPPTTSAIDTTGNKAIYMAIVQDAACTSITPSDSKGNTWSLVKSLDPGTGSEIQLWAATRQEITV